MKKLCLFLVFLCFVAHSFAQLDDLTKKKGKYSLKIINSPSSKSIKKPNSLTFDNTNGFKTANKKEEEKTKKKEQELALKNKRILTQAKILEERYNKNFKKLNGKYRKIDQSLGSFTSDSKFVRIICRDFETPDGDRISIYLNGEPIVFNIVLKSKYQNFKIPLKVGINTIAFKALNQGTSGPNTAAFKIYDDSGNLISANQWNLATGSKATIIITKMS